MPRRFFCARRDPFHRYFSGELGFAQCPGKAISHTFLLGVPCSSAAGRVAMSFTPRPRSLVNKFRDAFRGTKRGFRGESNFFVHLFIAAGVLAAAAALRTTLVESCLLVVCVAGVLA